MFGLGFGVEGLRWSNSGCGCRALRRKDTGHLQGSYKGHSELYKLLEGPLLGIRSGLLYLGSPCFEA